MIISTDAVMSFDKIQHPFMIFKEKKSLQKVGTEDPYLNLMKTIYDKPTASIILNSEKVKALFLRSEERQRCSLSPFFLFNLVLEILGIAIREEKNV